MKKRLLNISLMSCLLFAMGTVQAETSNTEIMAFTCFGCHGENGVSKGSAPSIKKLPSAYMEATLKDFKSGARIATIMNRIASGYSDEEIKALADYFSTL